MSVVELRNKADIDEKCKSGKIVIDFYSPWWPACKPAGDQFEAFAAANADISCFKVDCDNFEDDYAKLIPGADKVKYVPTFIVFKDGKQLGDVVVGFIEARIKEQLAK